MFWTCAFSCQLSLLIANEPPFLLCGVVCSCLSYLEATRTYLSNCLITRISSFILGRSQALSSPALCKTSFVLFERRTLLGCCVSRCSRGVCVYRRSSPCLLPGAWLRNYSQESRLQVVLGGILLSFCCVSSQDSGAFLPCKEEERVCVHIWAALYAEGWWQI